jgi:hypothetical protein
MMVEKIGSLAFAWSAACGNFFGIAEVEIGAFTPCNNYFYKDNATVKSMSSGIL